MVIANRSKVSSEVLSYIEKIPTEATDIEKTVFPIHHPKKSGEFIIVAKDDNEIVGVLIYKKKIINKRPYWNVITLSAGSIEAYNVLISQLLVLKMQAINVDGIFTTFFPDNHPNIKHALLNNKFGIDQSIFATSVSAIKTKLKTTPKLEYDNFIPSTQSRYRKAFTDFLVEHDIKTASDHNRSISKSVFKMNLRGAAHRIRVSYFINGVLASANWHAFILLNNGEPVGFVKGEVDPKTKTCFPTMYFNNPTYYNKYGESSLALLINSISYVGAKYVMDIVGSKSDFDETRNKKWYGSPLGHSYFV